MIKLNEKIESILPKVFLITFISTFTVWFFVFAETPSSDLEVNFFDVGQGDSILIQTPKNQTLLIDGGPNNKVLEKLGKYLPPLHKRIDIVLLTHPHADHVSGLIGVLRRYEVGVVILSGADLKTDVYQEFLKVVIEKNISVVIAQAGEAIHFDENLEIDILAPKHTEDSVFNKKSEGFGSSGNDVNDTSIVGKLIFNNFGVLLTGDATFKIENQLLIYGEGLKSDILKIGHHGSKYSSSLSFLRVVSPRAAIIEVGAKNRYGHPSLVALGRLKTINSEIFRTDLNGDIKILSDGFTTNIY
ncbi:MAG: MBL fold metallo-hydrolase, partial [Patescibacteria group bacterium]